MASAADDNIIVKICTGKSSVYYGGVLVLKYLEQSSK